MFCHESLGGRILKKIKKIITKVRTVVISRRERERVMIGIWVWRVGLLVIFSSFKLGQMTRHKHAIPAGVVFIVGNSCRQNQWHMGRCLDNTQISFRAVHKTLGLATQPLGFGVFKLQKVMTDPWVEPYSTGLFFVLGGSTMPSKACLCSSMT